MSRIKVSYRKDRERWQVEYWVDGKRIRPLFREKPDADNFARKLQLGLSPKDRDSITIDEAGKKYFASESQKKARNTKCNDKRYINLMFHFMTYVRGIEYLRSITLEDMEAFRDWLPKQTEFQNRPMHMGPSTTNRCIAMMKRFFIKHVQWKNIDESPCRYLEFLDTDPKPRAAMTKDQFLMAIDKAPSWFKPVMEFTYLTGAPGSCIERLTWIDVDFENRSFVIVRKKGASRKTRRIRMAMTEPVFGLLLAMRNLWPAAEGAVFRDDRGEPLLADRISRMGTRAMGLAGLRGVSMYSMRHGLASDLTNANFATELVRQAMGHASITTTQRYANKVPLQTVKNAIEAVRGGSLVANIDFERRPKASGKVD